MLPSVLLGDQRPRPLVYPAPGKDELFSSWITRVALHNHLRLPALLYALGHGREVKCDLDLTTPDPVLLDLAALTYQSPGRILQTSLRPLITPLQGDLPVVSPRSFLVFQGRGNGGPRQRGHPVCLSCLAENGQLRRRWRLITSVVCPHHGLALTDRCPACGCPVNLMRTQMTRATRRRLPSLAAPVFCARCQQPMLPVPARVPDMVLSAGLAVQGWIDQALEGDDVTLPDVRLPAPDFVDLLRVLMTLVGQRRGVQGRQLQFPPELNVGTFPATPMLGLASPEVRLQVVARSGYLLRSGVLPLLSTLLEAGVGTRELLIGPVRAAVSPWLMDLLTDALSKRPHARRLTPSALLTPPGPVRFTEPVWSELRTELPLALLRVRGSGRRIGEREVLEAFLTRSLAGTTQAAWTGSVGVLAISRRLTELLRAGHLDPFLRRLTDLLEAELGGPLPGTPDGWGRLSPESRRVLLGLLAPAATRALYTLGSQQALRLWTAGTALSLRGAKEHLDGLTVGGETSGSSR